MTTRDLRKIAHDSGDGETIYHCPFCGSGQVIARSDRSIECEFCHVSFTVQVQPQYPAFPQTIDGMPVQVPGMPGQIGVPGPPVGPDQVAEDGSIPGEGPPDDGSGFPPGEEEPEDAEGGGDEEDDEDEDAPPWAKKSALRTTAGHRLDSDDFVRHLAIRYAHDRPSMAARIKEERTA